MFLHVSGGRAVKSQGDPEHPANYGKLCTKGATCAQTLNTSDRLSQALLRTVRTELDAGRETPGDPLQPRRYGGGFLDGIKIAAPMHRLGQGLQLEMVARDDAEKAGSGAAGRPEVFLVLGFAGRDQFSLRGDEFDRFDSLAPVAPDALIPRHPAAEQITAQFHLWAMPAGIRHAEGVESLLHIPIADNRL